MPGPGNMGRLCGLWTPGEEAAPCALGRPAARRRLHCPGIATQRRTHPTATICRHKQSETQQYPYWVDKSTRNTGFVNVNTSPPEPSIAFDSTQVNDACTTVRQDAQEETPRLSFSPSPAAAGDAWRSFRTLPATDVHTHPHLSPVLQTNTFHLSKEVTHTNTFTFRCAAVQRSCAARPPNCLHPSPTSCAA